jgi:hypothetical protein
VRQKEQWGEKEKLGRRKVRNAVRRAEGRVPQCLRGVNTGGVGALHTIDNHESTQPGHN